MENHIKVGIGVMILNENKNQEENKNIMRHFWMELKGK